MIKPLACVLLILAVPAWAADGAELYRYTNDKGVVVLDRQGVPPQYIGNGYEVLNPQGRVVRVVPPSSREALQQRLEEQARASSDARLLRLYASTGDVDRAKARKLAELDSVMGIASGNLQSLRTQQANLQSQAADHERAGRKVPDALLTQLEGLKKDQARVERDIERYRTARQQAEQSFDADRARIGELLGLK